MGLKRVRFQGKKRRAVIGDKFNNFQVLRIEYVSLISFTKIK